MTVGNIVYIYLYVASHKIALSSVFDIEFSPATPRYT